MLAVVLSSHTFSLAAHGFCSENSRRLLGIEVELAVELASNQISADPWPENRTFLGSTCSRWYYLRTSGILVFMADGFTLASALTTAAICRQATRPPWSVWP